MFQLADARLGLFDCLASHDYTDRRGDDAHRSSHAGVDEPGGIVRRYLRILNTVGALGAGARPGPPCAGPPQSDAGSGRALRAHAGADEFRAVGG